MTPDLPPPRTPGHYAVGMVCLGNICRSPIADVVLEARLVDAGLDDRVTVASCGTGDWHVGQRMDPRAAATLAAAGLDPSRHRAQQLSPSWFADVDLLLAMDESNRADLLDGGGPSHRVRLLRDLDPVGTGGEVPDPYYGGPSGFEEVLAMVERSCATLVDALPRLLERG